MAVEDGKVAGGSLTKNEGDQSLARGAAGSETGARTDKDRGTEEPEVQAEDHGDLEARRETQQVLRPTSDGVGDGLPKDAA